VVPNIYVVGNLNSFFSAMTALQMLFNPANNTLWAGNNGAFGGGALIALGLVITLIILFVTSMLKQRFEMHQVLLLAVFFAVMFAVKTPVNRENMYNGDSSIVDGVPIGVAYTASIFSTVSYEASKEIGQAFQQANNTDTSLFTGSNGNGGVYGFDGPLALTYKLRGLYSLFSMKQAPMSNSVSSFVASCIEPTSDVSQGDIGTAGSLTCAFFGLNCTTGQQLPLANAEATLYVNSADQPKPGYTVPCSTASQTLASAWSDFQNGTTSAGVPNFNDLLQEKTTGSSLNGQTPASASMMVGTMLQGTANTGYDYMNNMILNCAFQAGEHVGLSVYDPNMPTALDPYCVTKATAFGRQAAMNAGTASLFGMNMLPLMAILQFLFFAMTPIVIGVVMMQGMAGLSNFGKFLLFGAWTESWMPVAALINDYSQEIIGESFKKMEAHMHGVPMTSPSNIGMILDHAQRNLSMANLMMGLTPVLTFAILSGSYYGFSQLGTAIRGDSVMDKNMSESTPTAGASTLAGNTSERTLASTGNGRTFETGTALNGLSYDLSQKVSSGLSAANTSAVQMSNAATTSASRVGEQTASYLHNAQTAVASGTALSSGANDTVSTMSSAQKTLSTMTGLSEANATTFAARLTGELGGNLNANGISEGLVAKALSGFDIGGKAAAEEAARITGEMKTSAGLQAASTLTNSNNLSNLSGINSSLTHSTSAGTSANLGMSAKKAWQEGASANAAMSQAEQLQRLSSDVQSQGGAQTFNADNLGAALEKNAARIGLSSHSYANDIADRNGIQADFDKGVADANRQGINGTEAASFGLIYAANRAPNAAAGASAITEAAGISPFRAQSRGLGKAVQGQIDNNAAQTDAGGNPAAIAGAQAQIAAVNASTGGAPTPGKVQAEYDAGQGEAAAAIGGNNGAGDYNANAGKQFAAQYKAAHPKDFQSPTSVGSGNSQVTAGANGQLGGSTAGTVGKQNDNVLMNGVPTPIGTIPIGAKQMAAHPDDTAAAISGTIAGAGALKGAAAIYGAKKAADIAEQKALQKSIDSGETGSGDGFDVNGNPLPKEATPPRTPDGSSDTLSRLTGRPSIKSSEQQLDDTLKPLREIDPNLGVGGDAFDDVPFE
jgi:conjugal transfer mating pair stabilization protein TraG